MTFIRDWLVAQGYAASVATWAARASDVLLVLLRPDSLTCS